MAYKLPPFNPFTVLALAGAVSLLCGCGASSSTVGVAAPVTLRNVSYDPTRELYQDYNAAFAKHWKDLGGGPFNVEMANGGSGKQARSVIDGLEADVVTLGLGVRHRRHRRARQACCRPTGSRRLPDNSCTLHIDHRASGAAKAIPNTSTTGR
jgi:ABC-type sulfate transport system substrate-binding protein